MNSDGVLLNPEFHLLHHTMLEVSKVLTSPQGTMAITVKPREGTSTEFLSQVGYQQMNSVQNTMFPRQIQIKFILSYSFIFEGLISKTCSFSNTESGKDENLS